MNSDSIYLKSDFPATPNVIYSMWLDSTGHQQLTGAPANISDVIGSTFTAWEGYISGTISETEDNKRILHLWRTSEFNASDPDSKLEIILEPLGKDQTRLHLKHTDIPAGNGQKYEEGWKEYYFEPMMECLADQK